MELVSSSDEKGRDRSLFAGVVATSSLISEFNLRECSSFSCKTAVRPSAIVNQDGGNCISCDRDLLYCGAFASKTINGRPGLTAGVGKGGLAHSFFSSGSPFLT